MQKVMFWSAKGGLLKPKSIGFGMQNDSFREYK